MTVYDALAFVREPLERLAAAGARPSDVRFVALYADYRSILGSGSRMSNSPSMYNTFTLIAHQFAII